MSLLQLANIPFDGYVASKNISVPFDKFPDGSYSMFSTAKVLRSGKTFSLTVVLLLTALVAEEFSNDDGKFAGKLTQTFYIRQQNATSLKQS